MASPERDPFERLYRRHVADVYRFVLAVVRNPTEAEDVTQTTFLNAYRALKRGHEPERVHSWLIAIAHNAIRSRHRWSLRRPKEVPLDEALHGLAMPAEDQATVREVLEVLTELPETQRTAIALRELEGRSYPEIAETMGVTVSAVESLIARARRTLRQKHANLRGLAGVPLPRSLWAWLERGDAAGTNLALKATIVLVAAGALAGGAAVTSHSAAADKQGRTVRPEPSRVLVARTIEPSGAPARTLRTPASPSTARPSRSRSSGSPPSGSPSSGRGRAPAPLPPKTTTAAGGRAAPPPPRRRPAEPDERAASVGPIVYRSPTPPTAPTLPTLPTLPSPPSSLDPSTWEEPTPPQLPTPPQPPSPPSLPQVTPPTGIK